MKADDDKPKAAGVPKEVKADPFWKGLPDLLEAIVDRFFDNGKPREPWSFSINYETGQPMVKVSDKARRRTAQVVAPTVGEGLAQLNEHIKNGTLAWRDWAKDSRR